MPIVEVREELYMGSKGAASVGQTWCGGSEDMKMLCDELSVQIAKIVTSSIRAFIRASLKKMIYIRIIAGWSRVELGRSSTHFNSSDALCKH